jgi:preprotein translocase subunit YajC
MIGLALTMIVPNLDDFLTTQQGTVLFAQAGEISPPGLSGMLLPLIAIMVFFYFLILKPQKNKEKSLRDMIASLKEKDRVITIGGIHGVVTNVQRDRDEITLRVDEATGAKIRVSTTAIARVVSDESKAEG